MSHATSTHVDHPILARWAERRDEARPVRVALADGDDPRVWEAAPRLLELGIEPVVLVRERTGSPGRGVEVAELGAVAAGPAGDLLTDLADARDLSADARTTMLESPAHVGAAMLRTGSVQACVAGNVTASAEVIRAGVRVLGLAAEPGLVSSSFLLVTEGGALLAFGDCAVVPEPDPAQLAMIAVATAETFARLSGDVPRVAMLSFSTMGSADHTSVSAVREATALARELRPGLAIDGELQFDAASVPAVAAAKAPHSEVAGTANVFIFPSLVAGNIGYKIAERLGGARAFGPILQGLARPLNDLSRGCSPDDIVNVGVISAIQTLDTTVTVDDSGMHARTSDQRTRRTHG
ncbi:phosphate acyltransferase [Aeromicrobium sp. CF4.19]|uniref:phosphate acyltransferase n=1 Tax=Aeromicrobium sp. CF4.19 TaxID=3373082 RepID=UPI003EE69BB8